MITVLVFSRNSWSCDICGGVNNSGVTGFMPSNLYHFIGIRGNFRHFESKIHSELYGSNLSNEYFYQTELFAKYQFSNRWQGLVTLPYVYNSRIINGNASSLQGMGDVSLIVMYAPLIETDSNGRVKKQLNLRFGAKVPTGMHAKNNESITNMYPGTGAFDIPIGLQYTQLFNRSGFYSEITFTYRCPNNFDYAYGAIGNLSGIYFLNLQHLRLMIKPFIGFSGTAIGKDALNGYIVSSANSGWMIQSSFGMHLVRNKWLFSFHCQLPIAQNLGDKSVSQKENISLSITYLLNKN